MSTDFLPNHTGYRAYVNVGAVHVVPFLEALGLPTQDEDGAIEGWVAAADLRARIVLAGAADDTGMPGYREQTSGATYVLADRAPGYLREKLDQLLEVCDEAELLGLEVVWY